MKDFLFSLLWNKKWKFLIAFLLGLVPSGIYFFFGGAIINQIRTLNLMEGVILNKALYLISSFGACFIVMEIVHYLKGIILSYVLADLTSYLKNFSFKNTMQKNISYFYTAQEGALVSEISALGENINTIINNFFLQILPFYADIFFISLWFFLFKPILALLALTWILIIFLITYFFNKKLARLSGELKNIRNKQDHWVIDSIKNYLTQKTLLLENEDTEIYEDFSKKEYKKNKENIQYNWFLVLFLGACNTILMCIFMFLIYKTTLSTIIPINYTLSIDFAFVLCFNLWMNLLNFFPIIKSIGETFCSTQTLIPEIGIKNEGISPPSSFIISFKNVSKKLGNIIFFKNLNLEIKKGDHVILKGRTGSGKTTASLLMMGLIDTFKGEILINNIPIKELNKKKWVERFSYVPQNCSLYDFSIKQNITRGLKSYSEINFQKACELCLVSKFLETHGDSKVGSGGNNLSGGEKQRTCLARTILRILENQVDIIILDEIFSSLDKITASTILSNISPIIKEKTLILIDHTDLWEKHFSIKNIINL